MFNIFLLILKFVFLAILYLFLLLTLRVIYKDVAPVKMSKTARFKAVKAKKAKSSAPRLIVLESPKDEPGKIFTIQDDVVVGRSPKGGIVLNDSFASHKHAKITKAGDQYYLEDLGSTNGTFLGEEKIKKATPLSLGDRIKIGKTILEFIE